MTDNENTAAPRTSHGFDNPSPTHAVMSGGKFTIFCRNHEGFGHEIEVLGAFGVLQPFDVLVQPVFTRQLVASGEMVNPLVRQHGLEGVGFGVHARPHQVVVRVGSMHLMEPVRMADLQ